MDKAVAYASAHGLELDQDLTFHDVGVSAYRGQNADVGRLACFVEAVTSGQVPQGSLLLVEQLDRISRLKPLRALDVLRSIMNAGVAVVTLNDGKVYTQESLEGLPMDLIMSILTFTRANDESEAKSGRLKSAWDRKRARIAEGTPLTSRAPAWLKLSDDRSRFDVIAERADLVQRMFDMTLAGAGQNKIASTLNEEGHAPWGRGKFWHRSYVAKILANPAVIGAFQPHLIEYNDSRKRRKPLEIIEGYYPAIVSTHTFLEVQALKQSHTAPQRGRHAHAPVSHVLAGLAVCPKCGTSMARVAKGARSRPAYVCSRAKSGAGCDYKSVKCELIEYALLQGLPARLRELEGATGPEAGLDDAIIAAAGSVSGLQERIDVLLDNLSFERSPAMVQRLRDTEVDLQVAQEALQSLVERQAAVTGLTVQARVQRVLEALQPIEGEPSVPVINQALRRIFRKAVIDYSTGRIELEWTHGGTCTVHFPTFKKWPGPGWRWQDEDIEHAD
jgi:DNA invertase Pin-like site-specific DNA recombinase